MEQSSLEREFVFYWRNVFKGPDLESELRFAPPRRWRWDFCHRKALVAVEMQGGIWVQGRHSRAKGISSDCEKLNEAQILGWQVFLLTSDMLKDDPMYWCKAICDAITKRLP